MNAAGVAPRWPASLAEGFYLPFVPRSAWPLRKDRILVAETNKHDKRQDDSNERFSICGPSSVVELAKAAQAAQGIVAGMLGEPPAPPVPAPRGDDHEAAEVGTQDDGPAEAVAMLGSGQEPSEKSGWWSCADLAQRHGVNQENLRSRLGRWRKQNGGGWMEVPESERTHRGPTFLFQLPAVKPVIDDMLGQ